MSLEKYKLDDGIYFPENFDPNDFNYSDGEEFERELFHLINSAQDKSLFSKELTKQIKNWPSFCHLSPVRTNLLRPISNILNGNILELGAGCGIISRYLGEIGVNVVALEGSLQRSKIVRARTADLNNVSVVCDKIESFCPSRKFDVVTMIGVLQYSRLFSKHGINAEIKILEDAIKLLDTNGALVIAIQNKLGLKYFAGYPEANTSTPFFGIENRYHEKSIIRFNQQEIQTILSSLGLKHQRFFYPFPDYHMPKTIISEKGIKELNPSSLSDLIIASSHHEKMRPDWVSPNFMLESAWENICSAGLASNLAHAFLIVASKTDKNINLIDENPAFAWHYSTDRPPEYAAGKEFHFNNSKMMVKGQKINEKTGNSIFISHMLAEQPYINGRMYWAHLVNIVKNPNWEIADVAKWALRWMQFVCKEANLPDLYNINLNKQMVDGNFYDCTPFNCILDTEENLNFIDKEWIFHFKIKLAVVFIRGLIYSLLSITKISFPKDIKNGTIGFIITLFKELNIDVSKDLIKEAAFFDKFCQKLIHDNLMPHDATNDNQVLIDNLFQLYHKDDKAIAYLDALPS